MTRLDSVSKEKHPRDEQGTTRRKVSFSTAPCPAEMHELPSGVCQILVAHHPQNAPKCPKCPKSSRAEDPPHSAGAGSPTGSLAGPSAGPPWSSLASCSSLELPFAPLTDPNCRTCIGDLLSSSVGSRAFASKTHFSWKNSVGYSHATTSPCTVACRPSGRLPEQCPVLVHRAVDLAATDDD